MSFDFIDEFLKQTDRGLSPERFRLWCALSTISAVTDRHVWTSIRPGMPLFPNLFVLLVGPAGAGKSQGISAARDLLKTQPYIAVAPSSTTHEAFIKLLAERSASEIEDEGGAGDIPERRSTMILAMSEWGTFMRKPSNEDMALLADIYDNQEVERITISRGRDYAENLFVNILSACTPAWFAEGFPPNSYEQGLPSRFHFIYSEGASASELPDFAFGEDGTDDRFARNFLPHLDQISRLRGFMPWTPAAGELFNAWKADDFRPIPDDPMLVGYCARRPMHLAKLAVLCAISSHVTNPIITPADFHRAQSIMFDAEKDMPLALSAAGGNTYRLRENAVLNFLATRWREKQKPIPEWEVRRALGKLVPPQLVITIINELIASGAIRAQEGTKAPDRRLSPGVRR